MLQLRNATPYACSLALLPDHEAIDSLVVAVTATCTLDGDLIEREGGAAPVEMLCGLPKPATDVLLSGHAHAPGGRADSCVVELRLGGVIKRVRVSGNRHWRRHLLGLCLSPSAAEPFERLPLTWERSYGGTATGRDGAITCDDRNPLGVGYAPVGERPSPGTPLPNLEHPDAPITSWRDRPAPAGFSALEAHWQPRRAYAGTYDDSWCQSRAPFLPLDFDRRHLQEAPVDQIATGHLRGDETGELINATPSGHERFRLPGIVLGISCRIADAAHMLIPQLNTVAIDADLRRIELLWRAALRCDKRAADIGSVDVVPLQAGG